MSETPWLFFGQVMHRRLRPVVHAFVYPVYFCRFRLDTAEKALRGGSVLFSLNRFNLFSLHYVDHGARDGSPPLPWIRSLLARNGIEADGRIDLLCFPRVLGFVFNPVSFWYCHNRSGARVAILAEVNNTFGEHHNYLLAHADGKPVEDDETLTRRKVFHVSPFMAVSGTYRFRFHTNPQGGEQPEVTRASIDYGDEDGDLLYTALSGRARPLTTAALLRAFLAYPLLTLGVVYRIHWQAFRLWLKRVPFFTKPEPPLEETTR